MIETGNGEGIQALATVARLLWGAAEQWGAQAEIEGPLSPCHLLSLGADLAACQAVNLLPDPLLGTLDRELEPATVEAGPRQLLRAAEELTRTLPIEAFPSGTSQVVVAIGDLIREATP